MHKQIAAGIGFCMSGVPYWTMDVGGFSVPQRFSKSDADPADVQEWRELITRWFEFCTFCPLLRVHGEFPHREMWEFGGDTSEAYQAQLKFDRLRYRLLPYIYSLAGWVTQRDYTIMRGLAMDFPQDRARINGSIHARSRVSGESDDGIPRAAGRSICRRERAGMTSGRAKC